MTTNQVDPYDEDRAMEEMAVFILNTLEIFQNIVYDPRYKELEKLLDDDDNDCYHNAILAAQKMREHFECGDYNNIHPQLVSLWATEGFKESLLFV
jgi:hypothetical protein